jgi:hypothetical protein
MPHSKSRNKIWREGALERRAKAMHKANKEFEDDTKHALSKPSQLTPLQLKRQARSESRKAGLRAKREANLEKRRQRINEGKSSQENPQPKPAAKKAKPKKLSPEAIAELRELSQLSPSEFLKSQRGKS